MQEIEHKKNKVYYTMGEVAEMFDVNPSLLRYWEQEFDILKPHRNKKGNRLFTPKDVDNIRVIYHLLKERKMKIEVARKYLRDNRKEVDRDTEITERLMHIRAILQEIRQDLSMGGIVVDNDDDDLDAEETPAPAAAPAAAPRGKKAATVQPVAEQPAADAPTVAGEAAAEEPAEVPAPVKPPFEEQMLFEVAVPLELLQSAAETPSDEGFASAKAAFEGAPAPEQSDEEGQGRRPQIIEQTLF